MTDLEQALAISGGIFAVMMASQYGDRDVTWHKFVFPLLSVAGFGWYYLQGAPTALGVDWVVYGVGALLGLAFGVGATVTTRVRRTADGRARTVAGPAFAAVWLTTVALRVAFVALAEHDGAFRAHLGGFMAAHRILPTAIAPFFMIMAAVMIATRVALIGLRVRTARPAVAPLAPVAAPGAVTSVA